jgi:UDP-2,3-diacylglucosamine hydrolase
LNRTTTREPAEPEPANERLFISDLHLSPQRSALTALFIDFLARRARGAQALYILGDLFDAWIGDDDDPLPEVRQALLALTAAGTDCAIMHGNRDFLIGRRFARATGCRLIRDPCPITLGGERILLMHGDLLCTDDTAYQRFRRRVRNPVIQRLFLWTPLVRRRRVAADYRARSATAMAAKTAEIMDVNPDAVSAQMRRFGATRLIHGHTHRPGDHALQINGAPAVRQVLADWHDEGAEALIYRENPGGGAWHREAWNPEPRPRA